MDATKCSHCGCYHQPGTMCMKAALAASSKSDEAGPAHWQRERANMQRRIRAQRKQLATLQALYNAMLAGAGWQRINTAEEKTSAANRELQAARQTFRDALRKLG